VLNVLLKQVDIAVADGALHFLTADTYLMLRPYKKRRITVIALKHLSAAARDGSGRDSVPGQSEGTYRMPASPLPVLSKLLKIGPKLGFLGADYGIMAVTALLPRS